MTKSEKMDLVQTWGDLDWEKENVVELYNQINLRVNQGYSINVLGQRKTKQTRVIDSQEDYTLVDMVIGRMLKSKGKADYTHWREVMDVLKKFGAKPACAIKKKMTPAQRMLARIIATERQQRRLKLRKRRLLFQLKKLRQK